MMKFIQKVLKLSKVLLLLIYMLFLAFGATAQTSNEQFDVANELYRNNKFSEAITIYETIEKQGEVSSELYYNLGNAYYKLNKVAPSIYNFEKALQINPQNSEAKSNLVFAKRMSIDTIEELPKTFLQNLEEKIIQQFSYNQWAVIVVISSILASLFFMFFYFSYVPAKKRLYFLVSVLSFIALVVSLVFTVQEKQRQSSTLEAIVYIEKLEVKNSPIDSSDVIFELHEGTKVRVLDTVDTWKKIKLVDGKVGWILKDAIKEL